MSNLIKPIFVSLDSSHLSNCADDLASSDAARRSRASSFLDKFWESGAVMLLSSHHLLEIIGHESEERAKARLEFLRRQPLMGWIRPACNSPVPGAVFDIMAAEARVALQHPHYTAVEVRNEVSKSLVDIKPGKEIALSDDEFRMVHQEAIKQAEHSRDIVAVVEADVEDNLGTTVRQFLNGSIRSEERLREKISEMTGKLAVEVATRGDKRIDNPGAVAEKFYSHVFDLKRPHPVDPVRFLASELTRMGIDPIEINFDTTLGEMAILSEFRRKLTAADAAAGGNVFFDKIKSIRHDQIPTWVIQYNIRSHAQDLPERKGSDLTDRYLACLAPYADITFVDKRARENIRRACSKSDAFVSLVRRVEKASNYWDVMTHLSKMIEQSIAQ